MKVKHNQRFYIVNNETYIHEYDSYMKEKTGERNTFIHYQWVIPMYVYSINKVWNGEERFNLSPVDFSLESNKGDNWRWMREFKYTEIGKSIFNTEEEAWEYYHKTYNDKVYQEAKSVHETKCLKEKG